MSAQTRTVYAPTTAQAVVGRPNTALVTVSVEMPHLAKYGRPTQVDLTYATRYDLKVGQKVLVPPTRLGSKWLTGTVSALSSTGFTGKVKYVIPLNRRLR